MKRDVWIRTLRSSPAPRAHVMCFPHAGGAATFYLPFAQHFPETLDIHAVQYPGRQERFGEAFVTTIEDLADQLVPSLRRHAGGPVPLVLFGHSMGASVAFETAARLAAEYAAAPGALIVSGRRAPSVHREDPLPLNTDKEIVDHLVALGGTDSDIVRSTELMDLLMPAIRNDYQAVHAYRPTPHTIVDRPIWCLIGEDDPHVTMEDASAWNNHTSADFQLRSYPGGHFFLTEHSEAVTRLIASCVESLTLL